MTTREQQIEQAERIARLNPEWAVEDGVKRLVRDSPYGCTVLLYWPHVNLWSGSSPTKDDENPDPAFLIRALGFSIIEQEQEP